MAKTLIRERLEVAPEPVAARGPAARAYRILHFGFSVLPIVAGLDKFFHILVNWDQYLARPFNDILGGRGHEFMLAAGVIEIVAGIGMIVKPRVFSVVVALWLAAITINLVIAGYYDIALRDFGLFLGALALRSLSLDFDLRRVRRSIEETRVVEETNIR